MLSQACLQCTNGKFCRAFVFRIRSFCPLEKSLNSPLSQFHSGLIICIKSLLLQLNYTLGTESQWFLEWELEGCIYATRVKTCQNNLTKCLDAHFKEELWGLLLEGGNNRNAVLSDVTQNLIPHFMRGSGNPDLARLVPADWRLFIKRNRK